MIEIVDHGVARILLPRPAGHAYVLLGRRPAVIDAGMPDSAPALRDGLAELGSSVEEVRLVLLTHEHVDHAGGAHAFPQAVVAAHPLAAAKLRHRDRRATHLESRREPDLELGHGSLVHAGELTLRVLHTPGHTSGSICFYERSRGLLFTGDTAFARGTLSLVSASGSRGDHLASLERLAGLPARLLLPGHGHISENPGGDLLETLAAARASIPGEDAQNP